MSRMINNAAVPFSRMEIQFRIDALTIYSDRILTNISDRDRQCEEIEMEWKVIECSFSQIYFQSYYIYNYEY